MRSLIQCNSNIQNYLRTQKILEKKNQYIIKRRKKNDIYLKIEIQPNISHLSNYPTCLLPTIHVPSLEDVSKQQQEPQTTREMMASSDFPSTDPEKHPPEYCVKDVGVMMMVMLTMAGATKPMTNSIRILG